MKTKFLLKTVLTTLFFSLLLFLCAGTAAYFPGWLFLTTNIVTALMNFWTIRNNPELMKERATVGEGAKSWDKTILGLSALTYVATIVVAGLDSGRYHWSPVFHWSLYATGVLLTLAGQAIFLTARNENHYFSSVVRIQSERGHTVCDTGIYKTVRHPGYLGMAISLTGVPLLTGSLWSMMPTALAIVLLLIRTYLEDETLKHELTGYTEYAARTRQRIIPLVW